MNERRRVPEAVEAEEARIPHHVLYPILGAAIGLGSPVGAFLMRLWLEDPLFKLHWMRSELSYNALFYWYMGLGTVASFAAFGYLMGRRSEHQRIRNADLRRRVEELRVASVTDGLTGVYTHAYLHESLGLALESAMRHGRPLSVLIMDIDDFKAVNDRHGHLVGDRVLQQVTETVNMSIRGEDVLGRYGGEEFVVIMPEADLDTARRAGERILAAVAGAHIQIHDGPEPGSLRVTLSIGAATFKDEDQTPQGLLRRADQNLYKAKRTGKNRVVAS